MSEQTPLYYDHSTSNLAEFGDNDMVLTRDQAVLPYSETVNGPVTDEVLVPAGSDSLRLRKFHLHADPNMGDGVYTTVTLKIGATIVFVDKFEAGLPYAEGIPIEGGVGEDLTISVTGSNTIYVNIRYQLF